MKAPCSDSFPSPTGDELLIYSIMTSMNFPTLPYDNVTYSFLLEIWFIAGILNMESTIKIFSVLSLDS